METKLSAAGVKLIRVTTKDLKENDVAISPAGKEFNVVLTNTQLQVHIGNSLMKPEWCELYLDFTFWRTVKTSGISKVEPIPLIISAGGEKWIQVDKDLEPGTSVKWEAVKSSEN